ncbi:MULTISPECIES: peptide deformylase [Sorangium]|uniref:Peptide deformylase n=1 Tax=Sorangium cellulosum TaxID=56 RepID=A0A4P2R1Y7_SORCE|nr:MULTISPECIES: peptide deformylase [Sorangium]AUX36706.1 peptide deformylase [Sorangium cellulosum]WCQ96004.1 Peptide deformylase [Sorangium sp. Soce836]
MELPPIVLAGRAVLRKPAAPVPPEEIGTKQLKQLVSTMVAVMRQAPGVGLAAPQIGVGQQVIVLEDSEALMSRLTPEQRAERGRVPFPLQVIVNPTLKVLAPSLPGAADAAGAGRATFFEGCLSVPGYMALVERDLSVEVSGVDADGKEVRWQATGWPARILQHEVDHLRGTLYVDRMISRSFCSNEEAKVLLGQSVAEARAALGA